MGGELLARQAKQLHRLHRDALRWLWADGGTLESEEDRQTVTVDLVAFGSTNKNRKVYLWFASL